MSTLLGMVIAAITWAMMRLMALSNPGGLEIYAIAQRDSQMMNPHIGRMR